MAVLQFSVRVQSAAGASSPTNHLDGHLQSSSPSDGGEELSGTFGANGIGVTGGCPAQLVAK